MSGKRMDRAWKDILIARFDDALRFFMPELSEARDWSMPVEFLKEELPAIGAESDRGMRVPDVVASVPILGGGVRRVAVVIEQQSTYDRDFPLRVFEGFYRISDRLRVPVTSLAIFTGNIREESEYKYDCFGTRLAFEYNSYSVAKTNVESLRNNDSDFALVALAARMTLDAGGNPTKRGEYASELLRLIRQRGRRSAEIKNVLEFIKKVLRLGDKDISQNIKEEWNMIAMSQEEALREMHIRWAQEDAIEDIAKKMLARGIEPDVVADIAGLPIDEVEALRQSE